MIKTKKCPVCNKKLLGVGMKNHIIGSAKGELYGLYFKKGKQRSHLDFVSKNTEIVKIEVIRLKS